MILTSIAVVTGVGECVVAELEQSLGGWESPKRTCLVVPGSIAWDECDCGMFAQTITEDVPSNSFPVAAVDQRTTACGPNLLVVTVTATVVRCVPTIGNDGRPPTCTALLHSAHVLEDDRRALRVGVTCCLREMRNDLREIHEFAVGRAVSVGEQGGCAGVELTYQFAVHNVCC